MALGEFDLIGRFFAGHAEHFAQIVLGVGDDAAILALPAGTHQLVSCDTLVSGVHFPLSSSAASIGHKALAVNLSDLAAMGATPQWCTLALTLPFVDETWLSEFARGFLALANQHACPLIGGDTTRGPLAITVTVGGSLAAGTALRRDAAKAGDLIAVTGTLGDAAAGLQHVLGRARLADATFLQARLETPTPRVRAGLCLREFAHAAIDVSDGLLADLDHVCQRSRLQAHIDVLKLPLSAELRAALALPQVRRHALTGGDDYELCVCLPAEKLAEAQATLASLGERLTVIGEMRALDEHGPVVRVLDGGTPYEDLPASTGFQHFRAPQTP